MKLKPTTASMQIPAPNYENNTVTFYPIVKVGVWEPFGYREDPEDKNILQPVTKELLLLEEAKKYLERRFSLRDVAAWLSEQSGRYISHQGLKLRVASDKSKNRDYNSSKHIARQLAYAYKKARYLESSWLGQVEPSDSDIRREIIEIADQAEQD